MIGFFPERKCETRKQSLGTQRRHKYESVWEAVGRRRPDSPCRSLFFFQPGIRNGGSQDGNGAVESHFAGLTQ